MNRKAIYGYISSLYDSSRQGTRPDERSLDILEQFIWVKYLSAYQICHKLKSTPRGELSYKNVNKRTNQLLSSGLIQKVETGSSKHKAIHYMLTEYGIYQLFLNRLSSIAPNKIEAEEPPLNSVAFLRNYSDSALFEIFLYPYFKKETLLAIGPAILWQLYDHISTCCRNIESAVKQGALNNTLFLHVFSWNDVPGKDNENLLSHLQEVFKLENIDGYNIKKEAGEYPTITVNITSASPIFIKLDKARDKVHIMSRGSDGKFQDLQYEVRHVDQEMCVDTRMPQESSVMHTVFEVKRLIEQIIYEFVYHLTSEARKNEEYSYYCKILSQDDRFMKVVQEIHENRHKGFEEGYQYLIANSQGPI